MLRLALKALTAALTAVLDVLDPEDSDRFAEGYTPGMTTGAVVLNPDADADVPAIVAILNGQYRTFGSTVE